VRVQKTVEKVNAKLKAAAGADATKVKQQALEKEIAQLKTEIEKLAKLSLAIDEPALLEEQITERATRLKEAKRELAALGEPQGPVRLLPTMTGDALRKRLDICGGSSPARTSTTTGRAARCRSCSARTSSSARSTATGARAG
jgi:hypothetical protein